MIIYNRAPTEADAIPPNHPAGTDKHVWARLGNLSNGTPLWNLSSVKTVVSYWNRGICIEWTNDRKDIEEWLRRNGYRPDRKDVEESLRRYIS